jgi:hypothetical protein
VNASPFSCSPRCGLSESAGDGASTSFRERLSNTWELAGTQFGALHGPQPVSRSGSAVSDGLIGWEDCSDLGRNKS